ncbi:hypothetical protein COLO4_27400 [Corchorus olitorius]|uniref:TF-B3 domain-containing protein n=1 Tax=Corchorus olitorius TaxID=93759 RepID=A0A1R3HRB5_9ROSI|nr:hypothetical protein COLO4_27400 [Corchorus olitorius]
MASSHRKGYGPLMFSNKSPHFFKIILQHTLLVGKLAIPKEFIKKYGKCMSSPAAFLRVPSGQVWKVELRKRDGKVWLKKGWREFSNHYSLQHGHFVVFSYEGKCNFDVVIMDTTASEIQYPYTRNYVSCNSKKFPEIESESEDDESMQILEDIPPSRKNREKSDFPCFRPHKKMKSSDSADYITESNLKSESRNNGCTCCRDKKLKSDKKACSLHSAIGDFKSENPFFVLVMQPSYVYAGLQCKCRLAIPTYFVRKHLMKEDCEITLFNSDGKTWPVQFHQGGGNGKKLYASLNAGWDTFVHDNNIQVGHICVFELINCIEISFKVVIFQGEDGNFHKSSVLNDVFGQPKGNAGASYPSQCAEDDNSRPLARKAGASSRSLNCWVQLNALQKAKALQLARAFRSENPSFTVVMQPSYVHTSLVHNGMPICKLQNQHLSEETCSGNDGEKTQEENTDSPGKDLEEAGKHSSDNDVSEFKLWNLINYLVADKAKYLLAVAVENLSFYEIPKEFINKYGKCMSTPAAFLRVPSGEVWKIEVRKSDGNVWLRKGWRQFSNHYSLKRGRFVVFSYEGKCNFDVVIMDTTASEIQYPYTRNYVMHNSKKFPEMIESESEDDIPPTRKSREKSSDFPCPRPHKKMRSSDSADYITETNLKSPSYVGIKGKCRLHIPEYFVKRHLMKEDCEIALCNSDGKTWSVHFHQGGGDGNPHKSSAFNDVFHVAKGNAGASCNPSQGKATVKRMAGGCCDSLNALQKAKALQLARAFKSENPSFTLVLQPSYVHTSRVVSFSLNLQAKPTKSGANVVKIECDEGLEINAESNPLQHKGDVPICNMQNQHLTGETCNANDGGDKSDDFWLSLITETPGKVLKEAGENPTCRTKLPITQGTETVCSSLGRKQLTLSP